MDKDISFRLAAARIAGRKPLKTAAEIKAPKPSRPQVNETKTELPKLRSTGDFEKHRSQHATYPDEVGRNRRFTMSFACNKPEFYMFKAVTEDIGMTASVWIREVLLREVKQNHPEVLKRFFSS